MPLTAQLDRNTMGTHPSHIAVRTSLATSSLARPFSSNEREIAFPSDRSSLLQCFDKVFDGISAASPAEIEAAFRLRYQVYCLDRGFEEAAACPDGLERDDYDDYAYHSLLLEQRSHQPLGTVRLVHPNSPCPNWITKLPLAAYADIDNIEELIRLPGKSTAEVSRFAISRTARQCLADPTANVLASVDGGSAWRTKLLPYMSLGLIRGLVRLSREHGVSHWCLAAEPSLLRRLRGFGLHFKEAGPPVEHRGLRQICYAELDSLLERAEAEQPEYWDIMTQGGLLNSVGAARNAA